MAYKIIIQPRAESDIEAAVTYIAEWSPQAAADWYKNVIGAIHSLAEMPSRCAVIPETEGLQIELRHLLYGKRPGVYRVVFRIVEDAQEVHVLTVRHGARTPLTSETVKKFLEP